MANFFTGFATGLLKGGTANMIAAREARAEEDKRRAEQLDRIALYELQADKQLEGNKQLNEQERQFKLDDLATEEQKKAEFAKQLEAKGYPEEIIASIRYGDAATTNTLGNLALEDKKAQAEKEIMDSINSTMGGGTATSAPTGDVASIDLPPIGGSSSAPKEPLYRRIKGTDNPRQQAKRDLEQALQQNVRLSASDRGGKIGSAAVDAAKFKYDQLEKRYQPLVKEAINTVNYANQGLQITDELKKVIGNDPSRLGVAGGLRGLFSNVSEQLDSLQTLLAGQNDENIKSLVDNVDAGDYDKIQGLFVDPRKDAAEALKTNLAYSMARAKNSGRLTYGMIQDQKDLIDTKDLTGFLTSLNQAEKELVRSGEDAVSSAGLEDYEVPNYFNDTYDERKARLSKTPETNKKTSSAQEDFDTPRPSPIDGKMYIRKNGKLYEVVDDDKAASSKPKYEIDMSTD